MFLPPSRAPAGAHGLEIAGLPPACAPETHVKHHWNVKPQSDLQMGGVGEVEVGAGGTWGWEET